jgi:type IV secretion system protein VirB10
MKFKLFKFLAPKPVEKPLEDKGAEDKEFENAAALTNIAPQIKRKNTMMILAIGFAAVVMAGIVFSSHKSKSKNDAETAAGRAARSPREFLKREMEGVKDEGAEDGGAEENPVTIPAVEPVQNTQDQTQGNAAALSRAAYSQSPPPPPPPGQPAYSGGAASPPVTAHFSPLVPQVEGSVLRGGAQSVSAGQASGGSYADQFPYAAPGSLAAPAYNSPSALPGYGNNDPYAAQNNQAGKQAFYDSGAEGALSGGYFLAENAIWVGTIIPAVLETAVNTDLPGNVVARVTSNIYDSRSGKHLLIPQGTLLYAKYNSSVSYAQKRVQIVWDVLIRPDGFQLALEGMNAVDRKGRSGAEAEYHENWFEYVKAAGIISMFSVANSKMAEEAAKYGGGTMAQGVVQGNSEFMQQIGGAVVSRAMNIQPTLTIDSGEKLNIVTNKTVYLPSLDDYPVTKKYTLQ